MVGQIMTIARFVVLEAWRTRLFWTMAIAFALALGVSLFVKELAITESIRVQVAFLSALARLAAVSLTALYVISTMAREFNDRVVDLTVSLELPRASFVLGKFFGYAAIAIAIGAVAGLLLSPFTGGAGLFVWMSTLMLELWIVVALSVFCIITFNQVMPAASFVLAFYLLARSIGALQLISASPLLAGQSVAHRFADWALNALAYLLPSLDRFSQTALLVDANVGFASLANPAGQTFIYVPLLISAALFDFYRKNF
jgi:ABC-type transport system involved in multi-copper enzyme maturation permease subunit